MLKPGRKRWFTMPQPDNAGLEEQKQSANVYAVLRDHVAYAAAIRNEIRQTRREQQELAMKVSELSSKVDTLISVATDLKGRVDSGTPSPGAPVVSPVEDDPEVERMAHRIDDAIAVLTGSATISPTPPAPTEPPPNAFPGTPVDPNAPV